MSAASARKAEVIETGSFYTITREPELRIYRMKCHGKLSADTLALAGKKCRAAACKDDFGFLLDLRACELPISITQAHQWFKRNYSEDESHLKFVKTAHLHDAKDGELISFTELAWRNQGARSKNFADEKLALEWLRGKS